MKRAFLFIIVIFFVAIVFLQGCLHAQPSVIGKWATISAFDGNVYINSKTDSFSMSERFKKLFGDSVSMAKKLFQADYLGNRFEFTNEGICHINPIEFPKVTGTYIMHTSDSTILLHNTDTAYKSESDPKYYLSEAKKLKYFFVKIIAASLSGI